jgi:hypothetical protein
MKPDTYSDRAAAMRRCATRADALKLHNAATLARRMALRFETLAKLSKLGRVSA